MKLLQDCIIYRLQKVSESLHFVRLCCPQRSCLGSFVDRSVCAVSHNKAKVMESSQ